MTQIIDHVTGIDISTLSQSELNEMGIPTPHECVDLEVDHDGYDEEYVVCRDCGESNRVFYEAEEG